MYNFLHLVLANIQFFLEIFFAHVSLLLLLLIKFLLFKNWEDVMDSSFCYLLRNILAKSDKDRLRTAQTNFEEVKDISRFEKHFIQVIERINKNETQETEETGKYFERKVICFR